MDVLNCATSAFSNNDFKRSTTLIIIAVLVNGAPAAIAVCASDCVAGGNWKFINYTLHWPFGRRFIIVRRQNFRSRRRVVSWITTTYTSTALVGKARSPGVRSGFACRNNISDDYILNKSSALIDGEKRKKIGGNRGPVTSNIFASSTDGRKCVFGFDLYVIFTIINTKSRCCRSGSDDLGEWIFRYFSLKNSYTSIKITMYVNILYLSIIFMHLNIIRAQIHILTKKIFQNVFPLPRTLVIKRLYAVRWKTPTRCSRCYVTK